MAFAAAEKVMGVTQLLDKNDFSLSGKNDEKSIILYVAKLKQGCDLLHTYRARLARSLDEQRPRVLEGEAPSVMLMEPSPQHSALQWLQHQPQSPLESPDRDGQQSSTVFPNPPQSTPPGDGLVHPISKERAAAVLSWAQGLLDDKDARIAYAKEVFAEADADGSGSMEITEAIASVHEMARAVDLKLPSHDEIRKLLEISEIGHKSSDSSLHEDEFLTFFKAMLESALKHSKVSTPEDESALKHSTRRVLPATPDPAAPTTRPEKKSSVVEAKAKTDFFFKRSWKDDVNTAKSPAAGKVDLCGEDEGGYEQPHGYDETGRGDEGVESKMSPDSLHTWALAAIDASDDDMNPDIPSFPQELALALAARIEERVDANPAPDSPYDPELDPDNRQGEARPDTSPAMRRSRLSREHEHKHTATWKKRPSTPPRLAREAAKTDSTPPRLARDAAKTASDAAMASLSATTAEAAALAALDSAKNAATAAEAARGAEYAAAAATSAQEALIQAQAAEAEALMARDLALQLEDDDLTIFIAALATASSHARDAAGAASSAVAAAAAAHEAAEAAAARETALAAAKARLKALRLELAAEAAALSSLEKAASESSYETALEARLREIESPRRPPSNLVIAEALAAATKDLVRVTFERDRARAEADAAALALTTVLPPDTVPADVLRRLARRLHHHKSGARYGAGESSEERSALNVWQRRVLSWQRSVLGSEATSPCTSPPSSPSKLPVLEAEPEVVLRTAPPRSAPPVAPIPAAPMPQVAASTSSSEGALSLVLVDCPPAELRDRLPPPAPPAALGLLATLTKLVPRLSVAMIVWFVMIILLELLSRVYMAFADPTAAVGIVVVAPKLRMVESELFARAFQHRFVGWWKVHMAQMPDQLQLGAAAAGQLLAIHKDLLVIQLRATSASIAHWAKERSKRHLGRVESAWRHAVDVAPSPTHCKLPHVMMHWYSVEVLRKKGCTAPVFQWDVSY